MSAPIRILYWDEHPGDDHQLVLHALDQGGRDFLTTVVASRADLEAALQQGEYDLILADTSCQSADGTPLLDLLQAPLRPLPLVVLATADAEALEALGGGAADYVLKQPASLRRLPHAIRAALEREHQHIERQRLQAALREAGQLRDAAYRISQAADSAASLDDLYRLVHEIIGGVMPASNFYIALYDAKADLISFPYFVDAVDVQTSTAPTRPSRGLTEYVLRTGRPLLCDAALHETLRQQGEAEVVGEYSPIWLGVPLTIEGGTIGVMVVQHYSDPHAYGEPEQRMLEYVSSQVAHAIERKRSEAALRRRDRILEAVGFAAEQFLRSTRWEDSIPAVLTRLGEATDVSRVYVFECHAGDDGTLLVSQRYEWTARGIVPQIDNPDLQGIPLRAAGFERWEQVLSRGEPLYGHIADFPESEQALLAAQEIRALVVVPVFVEQAWWGFIGFDDCVVDREWTAAEVEALRAAAGAWGAALERRRGDEALRRSEFRFRALIDNGSDLITILDRNGIILYESPSSRRLLGYEPGELRGRSTLDFIHPDDMAPVAQAFQQLVEQPQSNFKATARFRRKDGSWCYLESIGTNMFANPAVRGMIINSRDITERMQREREQEAIVTMAAALRAAATRAEMLPVVLDQALVLLDAQGAALDMLDPAGADIVTELGRGAWAETTGRRSRAADVVSGRVIASGEPIVSAGAPTAGAPAPPDLAATACLPLSAQGQAIGALWIGRQSPFSEAEVRLLAAICDMAANAMRRAALHEQTEQRLRRLAALRAVDTAITASLDLRVTLNVLLDQIVNQLRVDAVSVLLLDVPLQSLTYGAGRGFRSRAIERTQLRVGEGHAGRAALERRTITVLHLAEEAGAGTRAALLAGEGFSASVAVPLLAKGQIKGVLELYQRAPLAPDPEWLDFLETLASQAAIAVDNASLFEGLQRANAELNLAYDTTLAGWSQALDLRDEETEGHTQRVTDMTLRLGRALGLSEAELVHVRRGALLHDIGKMGIPDGILLKPGPLSEEEWAIMRKHPEHAYNLLSPISHLRPALDIPYCHHEKWDGSGYPRGLAGEAIPFAARVFAVADVYDALRSDRPYRPAWPEEKVREHIRSLAGSYFDPRVVEEFLKMIAGA